MVVTLPPESNSNHLLQSKASVFPFSRSLSLQKLPEAPKHKEKERRAVVVRTIGKDRVGAWARREA